MRRQIASGMPHVARARKRKPFATAVQRRVVRVVSRFGFHGGSSEFRRGVDRGAAPRRVVKACAADVFTPWIHTTSRRAASTTDPVRADRAAIE
jgi:hypothetical protein